MKTKLIIEIETPDADKMVLMDPDGGIAPDEEKQEFAQEWHNTVVSIFKQFNCIKFDNVDDVDIDSYLEEYYDSEGNLPGHIVDVEEEKQCDLSQNNKKEATASLPEDDE